MTRWKNLSTLPDFNVIVEGRTSDYMGDFTFKCQRVKYKEPIGKMAWRWCDENGMLCNYRPEKWREL